MNVTNSQEYDNFTLFPSLYVQESIYFAENFVPVTVFLITIFVVGSFGNSLTFFLYFTKFSRSNHRVLVLWLSTVDFLSSVEGIPFVLYDLHNTLTFTNEPLCKIGKLLGVFFPSFSLGLLTFIAAVRYWKVCMPFRTGLTPTRSNIICAVIGASEFLLLAVPALQIYGIKQQPVSGYQTGHDCTISAESATSPVTTYQRIMNGVLFTISFSVCLVIYILIGRTLIKRSKISVVDTPTRPSGAGNQKQKTNTLCKHGNISTIGRHTKVNTIARPGKPSNISILDVFMGKDKQNKQPEESSSRYPNSDGEYQNRDDTESIVSDDCISDQTHYNPPDTDICNCDCMYNSEDEDENMPSSDDDSIMLVHHTADILHKTDSCASAKDRVENCQLKKDDDNQTPGRDKIGELLDMTTNKIEVRERDSKINLPTVDKACDQKKESSEANVPSGNNKPAATGSDRDKMNRVFSFRVSPAVNRGLTRSRRLSIIFLVVTALSFGTCLPFLLFSILKVFDTSVARQIAEHANVSSFLTYFYFFNSALNPIVYGFMDSKFRREIKLCCKRIKKRMIRFFNRKKTATSKYYI
ncbi:uncharacterized protein LOC132555035 [Ylistrum balloti]|uniref:uncharacterized protein LOC132555035 n=1 Tax=Ylistrum balloti TaxID=509963 RepID=UPI002905DFAE|nr:uncharacterized protein LOC132555035 [Ylistrum balloti]